MSALEELKKKISDIETQSLAMDGCRPTFTVSEIMDLIDSVGLAQNSHNACTDTISRQAAIDAIVHCTNCVSKEELRAYVAKHYLDNGWTGGVCDALDAVEDLPSEQPERKMGKWIYNSPMTMKCDQCGFVIKDWDWHRFKFCPNCSADMRGEQE